MINKEIKQESSIPVQGRVSLIVLSELASYWDEETEFHVKTMSQLIGWSMDLLREILVANDMLEESDRNIAECRDYLIERGLWQKSLGGRAFKKIGAAVRFQNFREEGRDPKNIDEMSRKSYNIMHNEHSVKPSPVDKVEGRQDSDRTKKMSSKERKALVSKAVGVYHGLETIEKEEPKKYCREEVVAKYRKEQAELKRLKEETIDEVKHGNIVDESSPIVKEDMTDEEYGEMMKDRARRDRERIELEQSAVISEGNIVGDPLGKK